MALTTVKISMNHAVTISAGCAYYIARAFDHIRAGELEELTRDLVRIQSHRDTKRQELGVAKCLHRYFNSNDMPARLRTVAENRPNVIAILKGSRKRHRSLMLNGHMDTVPIYSWTGPVPPFSGRRIRNRIYGRGTSDMKGALACMAVAMKALKKAEVPLAGDLVFSGVVGEEGDCSIGAEDIARNGPRTDYAIVGEPTDLDVCVAHKGLYNFKVEIVGKTAHSATPQLGVNAIQKCSLLLRELARIEEIGPRHMLLDRTTVVPTTIRGGYRGDVIPDSCTLNITCRNVPAYPVAKLKERLQRLIDTLERRDPTFKAKLSLPIRTVKSNFGPLTFDPRPVETPKSSLIVRSLIRSTRLFGGKSPTVKGARLFADASILQNHGGIETCLFGPSGPRCGAHSAVEYIEVEDLVKAARIYTATAVDICEVQT